jgi:hypothetical protein
MTRIRFDGCDLSRAARGTPVPRVYGSGYTNGAGDRHHPFRRIRIVIARGHAVSKLSWHFDVRPRARTIYIAEANSEPDFWARAWSKSFRVNAHR